jgi:hypothetical protein
MTKIWSVKIERKSPKPKISWFLIVFLIGVV